MTAVEVVCANCGGANPPGARFCSSCGAALGEAAAPPQEERKLVSVLFVDLVGSTARADKADPEDVRDVLQIYHREAKQCVEQYGGVLEKFIGDAVMAVFGAPVAHGDDAERAVRAGLRVLEGIDELNQEHALDLAARAAVNTGEVVVSLDGDDAAAATAYDQAGALIESFAATLAPERAARLLAGDRGCARRRTRNGRPRGPTRGECPALTGRHPRSRRRGRALRLGLCSVPEWVGPSGQGGPPALHRRWAGVDVSSP